ncbi:acyltransferase family protein, partial [Amycolatopsis arida]
ADRLLSTRPLEYLGNLSYALYLWHWPVLLFYLVTLDQPEPGVAGGLLVIAVSLGLAVLTYHFVETPVREGRLGPVLRMGAYRLGVLMLAPVLVMAGAWQVAASQKADYTISLDDPDHPGAISRLPDFTYAGAPDAPLAPRFISLPNEFAEIEPEQCHLSPRSVELRVCATETEGPPPERTIVVAGDSHAQQFIGALRPIAERRNWRIVSMLRGGCPFSTRSETVPGDQPCVDWNAHVVEEIVELRPDAVFTTATRDVRVGLTEETPPGFVEQWRALADAGIPVLAARDNPRYDFWPSICVEAKGRHADACATPRAALLAPEPPYRHVPDLPPNVRFLDFSDFLCTEDVCPPVIGNVLVYLDDNHVTETYMRTMAPIVEGEILAVMDW